MKETVKSISNIDALKVCLKKKEGEELFSSLHLSKIKQYDGITIKRVKMNKTDVGEDTIKIDIEADIFIDETTHKFGVLTISNKNPYCFIKVENRMFYEMLEVLEDGEQLNMASLLPSIIGKMGNDVILNNITSVDVCMDFDVSAVQKVRKAILDVDHLNLYVCNRRHTDDEREVNGCMFDFSTSRRRLIRKPSIYFKNNDHDNKMQVKIYDKANELKVQSPQKESYTREWDGITGRLHRLEVSLTKEGVREYQNKHHLTAFEVLKGIFIPSFRLNLLLWGCDKLIYFKDREVARKKKGGRIGIVDIITNNKPAY